MKKQKKEKKKIKRTLPKLASRRSDMGWTEVPLVKSRS
jgi:hypothetical protein